MGVAGELAPGDLTYIREKYPDDAETIAALHSRDNWGPHLGMRLAEAAAVPLGAESQRERSDTLLRIAELHHKSAYRPGEWAYVDLALEQYRQVMASARPGESYQSVMGDYLTALRGLSARNVSTAPALANFRTLRQEVADRERLQKVMASVGDPQEARRILDRFDALPPSPDREARVAFGVDLAVRTGTFRDAAALYGLVDQHGGAEHFAEAADLMSDLLGDASAKWASDAGPLEMLPVNAIAGTLVRPSFPAAPMLTHAAPAVLDRVMLSGGRDANPVPPRERRGSVLDPIDSLVHDPQVSIPTKVQWLERCRA